MKSDYHIPVMLEEVLEFLTPNPGKIFVDATTGTGGHSIAIVERLLPGGRLICVDRDGESLSVAQKRMAAFKENCAFLNANFTELADKLKSINIENVDGLLFDLGISSYQLRDSKRGFSFQEEAPLDMRMDRSSNINAEDLINNLTEEEISNCLRNFGQERWHRRIARILVSERQVNPIRTTRQLRDIVLRSLPTRFRNRYFRIDPATRTFQAIRIAVNNELENIKEALDKAIDLLSPGGKICVISFHSLEDRIVKIAFRQAALKGKLKLLTKKPLTVSREELNKNPLSRSAKFRAAERLDTK